MTTADDYINNVLDYMPPATPMRSQIAMELRGHISERLGHGHSIDEVLGQLGDPAKLAESYLSAVPLASASFGRRAAAKIVDVITVLITLAALAVATRVLAFLGDPFAAWIIWFVFGGSVLFGLYTVLAEFYAGQTLGKRLLGIRVVRETGARIGLGQSVVRQLPMFLQMYWIDVFFALFTEKRQRAFELLSKTRVVIVL